MKMKKVLSVLMVLTMLIGLASAFTVSLAASNGDLEFSLNEDGVSYAVSGCVSSASGEIVIPPTYDGKPVTLIDMYAFSSCESLTGVTIPNSVMTIDDYAFSGCTNLMSIIIPDSVAKIGVYSFRGCTNLASISFPASLEEIGGYAFTKTAWFDNKPDGVVYIDNFLYSYKGTMPPDTEIDIINGTTVICSYAFKSCTGLTSVIIPNSVVTIGSNAFLQCTELTEITIPASVTKINSYAFYGCAKLAEITIPDLVTKITSGTFKDCTGLTEITIPDSVTEIGADAFSGCTGLTEITIPDSVTEIGADAFSGCTGLADITVPETVTGIGGDAFLNTTWYNNLPDGLVCINEILLAYKGKMPINTSIVIPNGIKSISSYAFSNSRELTAVTISDSVVSIGAYAFSNCAKLKGVTIPNSVVSIGKYAFSGCSALTSIIVPAGVTAIDNYAFFSCANLVSVIIPDSVTEVGSDAFVFSDNVVLYGYIGSYAEVFADNKRLSFSPLGTGVTSDSFTVSQKYISTDDIDLTAGTLINGLTGVGTFEVYNANTELLSDSVPGTGAVVKLLSNDGVLKDMYTLAVKGDLNGDSVRDSLDLMSADLALNGHYAPIGAYKAAAIEGDDYSGTISVSDYQYIEELVCG